MLSKENNAFLQPISFISFFLPPFQNPSRILLKYIFFKLLISSQIIFFPFTLNIYFRTLNFDYNSKKQIIPQLMYYYHNPYYYAYQPQLFFYPTPVQPEMVQNCPFQIKQTASQEQKKELYFNLEPVSAQKNQTPIVEKVQDPKQQKQQVDSDYEPDNNQTIVFYKKKNTESNLSNQIYSFISSYRSLDLLLKIFNHNKSKVEEFYKLIKKIKKGNKKYMNRVYISDLMKIREENTNFKIYQRSKCSLKADEIRRVLRIAIKYFLENVCETGLLTSKKMNKTTLMEHFARKREIKEFLFEYQN